MKNRMIKSTFLGALLMLVYCLAPLSGNAQKSETSLLVSNQLSWNLKNDITTNTEFHFAPNRAAFSGFHTGLQPFGKTEKVYKRKSPFLAAAMNFILPGAGYLYNGQKHPLISVGMMAGAIGLTYVELNLQNDNPDLYPIMFGSVFVLNTSIAIDTFFKTKKKNEAHNL